MRDDLGIMGTLRNSGQVHCGLAKVVDATGMAIAFVLPGVAIVAVVDE